MSRPALQPVPSVTRPTSPLSPERREWLQIKRAVAREARARRRAERRDIPNLKRCSARTRSLWECARDLHEIILNRQRWENL